MNWVLLSIFGYVALQLLFGVWVGRKVRTERDYLLAGRSLGPLLSTFTVFATWFGAETCIGAAAEAYGGGLSATTADPFGYALCLFLMGVVFAVPLWKRKLTTMADLFRETYGVRTERGAALLMVPTSVMWAGAQIRAFGQVLGAASDLDLAVTITLAAVVVVAYTAMGGLLADAMSDVVQGSVLVVGLASVFVAFVGSGDAVELAAVTPERWSFVAARQGVLATAERWAIPVIGSVVAQELVARVIAARSPRIARVGSLTASGLYLATGSLSVLLGLAASRVIPDLASPEQVLPRMAARYLPGALHVLFLGALVSAILSTVDSALLVAGSLVAHNLVLPQLPEVSERRKVAINRIAVVAFGGLAYGLALSADGVYSLVEEASALGTSGIFVCTVFALFGRFGGPHAATCALVLGAVVYGLGAHLLAWPQPYLSSLVAAMAGYVFAGCLESLRPDNTPRTKASGLRGAGRVRRS